MKIHILTTEKQLTKSRINQMRQAPQEALSSGVVLGYLNNIVKNVSKAALIEYDGDYYLIPLDFIKEATSAKRYIGKSAETMKFTTEDSCNRWWRSYERVKILAIKQIYV